MKILLPTTIAIGIAIGMAIRPSAPEYLSVTFEPDNHYVVEQTEKEPIIQVAVAQAAELPMTDVEKKIHEVFGAAAKQAIIVAKCESGLNPQAHGDKNLMVYNQGDLVGDSIGVFQIRTGGKDFNRARANKMTPDEFRTKMWDADENIKYAKEIYDRQGWAPWTCKKDL